MIVKESRVVILTGAGISAESGIRTFRDFDGLWENHRIEEVATPEGWEANPQLVWGFYQQRRRQLSSDLDTLRQRVRHGCKSDLLKLVKIRHVGRQRARSLASIGIRTPKDVLAMTRKDQQKIASWRGWGPKLVHNIMTEVKKVVQRDEGEAPAKKRSDDMPLDGEDWA